MSVSSGSCISCNMSTQAEKDNIFNKLEELPDSSQIFGSMQLLNDESTTQDEASGRQLVMIDHLYDLLCWSLAVATRVLKIIYLLNPLFINHSSVLFWLVLEI
ncbi:hypothetical protein O6H91_01G068000 [Diphasiastrum complanatum]|uniref:Uncharacterized protein n=1 Tax=Diphasiastrum complanatum TaxID=34168 RepID=A0ACC2ES62_DIPCM|nr:hypothetical protein O6H91_01G068000 [Diphasiastrum complanatum]